MFWTFGEVSKDFKARVGTDECWSMFPEVYLWCLPRNLLAVRMVDPVPHICQVEGSWLPGECPTDRTQAGTRL